MSAVPVPDDLWERMVPLLPPRRSRRNHNPGRLPVPNRVALAGIVCVLRRGGAWRDVPAQVVGCSEVTSWRRLRDWTEASVRPRLHAALLSESRAWGLLAMDDTAIDGFHVCALKGGDHVGPSPVDRARPGSRHHVIIDQHGTTPAAATISTRTAACCGRAESSRSSPDAGSLTVRALGAPGGWSSAHAPGSISSNGCGSATTAVPISAKGCWSRPAESSAFADSGRHSETISQGIEEAAAVKPTDLRPDPFDHLRWNCLGPPSSVAASRL